MSGDELPAHAAPFALELPEGTRDASTWCFVLPGERSFSPSVVIKRDDLPEDQSPLAYLVAQAAQLAEQLPGFELLAEPSQPEEGPPSCRVRWGGDPQSYVQTLRVQPLGEREVLLVTATAQPDATEDALAQLEAVASSVVARPPEEPAEEGA